MKRISNILIGALLFFVAVCCDEEILNQLPEDSFVEETIFTTDSNFETYAWGFYEWFPKYSTGGFGSEFAGDLMSNKNINVGNGNSWLWQNITIPASSSDWNTPYSRIRRVNLMLNNIDSSELTEAQKAHWTSVGYFFRAMQHFELLSKYGAIIYVDKLLTENDEDILKGPRTSREVVAQNILNDLEFAEDNIRSNGNGINTVNTDVVRAFISRFGLFEGTWRKYHGISGGEEFLQASADASAKLIASHPNLHPSYDEVFNSQSLAGVNGILLHKSYALDQTVHRVSSFLKNSAGYWDMTKKAVDQYLCIDGQTRWTSPLFDGDSNPYDEFRNRDRRLYFTTTPPFKVNTNVPGQDPLKSFEWEFTSNPADREYIDLMVSLSDKDHKVLPTENWNTFIIIEEPHFRRDDNGQPFSVTSTGYRCTKYYNNFNRGSQHNDLTNSPIFRMGEILLNYAEAKFELGQFTQEIADITINKLRDRGQVAHLNVGNVFNDPTRDTDVAPVLWEIRRERAVELMMENFRFNDLRRWKKLHVYGAEEKLGRYVFNSEHGGNLPIKNGASEGYIAHIGEPPGVPIHYYLYPIPSEERVLNPQLDQNPGWED